MEGSKQIKLASAAVTWIKTGTAGLSPMPDPSDGPPPHQPRTTARDAPSPERALGSRDPTFSAACDMGWVETSSFG